MLCNMKASLLLFSRRNQQAGSGFMFHIEVENVKNYGKREKKKVPEGEENEKQVRFIKHLNRVFHRKPP